MFNIFNCFKDISTNGASVRNILRLVGSILILMFVVTLPFQLFSMNNAGERTVVQYPWGTLSVKFDPGIYFKGFGKQEVYKDVVTYDFDKTPATPEASVDVNGVKIRYQDGGMGTIYGKVRLALPNDSDKMIHLHRDFRSGENMAFKMVKPVVEEALNLTAGLMTSEEAYAEKRSVFTQWAEEQINLGKFKTQLKSVMQKQEATNERVERNIPIIVYNSDGSASHNSSDLKSYSIKVTGFQLTDWDFETKTLEQISKKREATMGIITAKADAERARQEALTAEEQGKKDVMVAKYTKEQEKVKAVVDAEKEKSVAVTKAQQGVLVAEQGKLEAEQHKLAAEQYKQEQTLRGQGDGEYKRLVMAADGALSSKIEAWVKVNKFYADAIEKQKWVPEIQMGNGGANGSAASDLIELLKVKTAKDLNLDLGVKTQAQN
jgi:regulator of protease activity HflC (stomatin/prohibitin superfamily)